MSKQGDVVMGVGLDLAELTVDLELHDVIQIDGDELLPNLIVKQNTIFHNGDTPYELIIPQLTGESEAHAHIYMVLADIDHYAFQFKRGDRSFLLVGHYRKDLRHAVYKT